MFGGVIRVIGKTIYADDLTGPLVYINNYQIIARETWAMKRVKVKKNCAYNPMHSYFLN